MKLFNRKFFKRENRQKHAISRAYRTVWPTILCALFLALLFSLLICIFFKENLSYFYALFGVESKDRLIEIVGIAIAGNILLIQATVSHRRAVALERSAESQVEANNVLDRGNRQERLNGAIDHLGSSSTTVRLSAGYELFDLATSHEDLRYSIFSILCAHIRETTKQSAYQNQCSNHPSEEIQSLLNILFVDGKECFENMPADLSGCWFIGANFRRASLKNANLDEANMNLASLHDANFRDCSFFRTRLRKVFCYKTEFQNSNFDLADLRDSHLSAMMQGVSLSYAKLDSADLSHAKLQGACLTRASLKGANLTSTCFHGANLVSAKLQGAFVDNAQFQGADLVCCDMRGVLSEKAPVVLSFEDHMKDRCHSWSDFNTVTFKGGLTQSDIDEAVKYLRQSLQDGSFDELSRHLGPTQPIDPEIEFNVGVGEFTREEVERWITAHNSTTNLSTH